MSGAGKKRAAGEIQGNPAEIEECLKKVL